jgi:hypothetical protein
VAAIPNERFFPSPSPEWPPRRADAEAIPDVVFYGDARPPAEPGLAVRWASRPVVFGVTLFLLGWLGILVQRSFLQQIVVGAPVFEELAKFGLALVVVTILRAKHVVARLPYAWLSGMGFGVLEHFVTYGEEDWATLLTRVAFHTATAGLSMAAYSVVEPLREVRSRWLATLPSTLLHWSNNFGVVLAVVVSFVLPLSDQTILGWSLVLIGGAVGLTFAIVANESRARALAAFELRRFFQPLGPTDAAPREGSGEAAPSPPDSGQPPAPPPEPPETSPQPPPPPER